MAEQTKGASAGEPRNLLRLWICVAFGMAIWFSPIPAGLTAPAWHVFAVFAATILSFLLRPLPMAVCVLLGLLVLGFTGALVPEMEIQPNSNINKGQLPPGGWAFIPLGDIIEHSFSERVAGSFKAVLSGFANTTVWLVVAAFLISGAMVQSGLGRRVALMMVAALGRTTLGLGYAIAAAELLLAPFIPSNTARGGGLMMPIVRSICGVLGSEPEREPKRAGEYLVLCGAHLNLITAAMFLTGMAANPLVARAASDFLKQDFGWGMWLKGSIVPGIISLLLTPLLLYWLARPELSDAREAQKSIRNELKALGPWTPQQITMAIVLAVMLLVWATAPLQESCWELKLPTPLVALGGVAALIVLGVLPYERVKGNAAAWDTLLWLGGLISMADALKSTKFVDWFAEQVQSNLGGITGIVAAIALAVVYFYSMYAFSMLTGHILAFTGVFFTVSAAVGAPPLVMIAMIAYFSNLCGCTTNYSTGPTVIYSGLGYVSTGRWFAIGFVMSLAHLAVWLGVGLPWWKLLGWW